MNQKISQQELADYLKVSRQTVSKWELGKSIPDLESLTLLADYFEISLDVLVGRKKIGFFSELFSNNHRKKVSDMTKGSIVPQTGLYSMYLNDLRSLFSAGQRVATYLQIGATIFPKATFPNLMGCPTCLCSIEAGEFKIQQITKMIVFINVSDKQLIASFPLTDIKRVKLSFGKSIRVLGGSFMTFLDIETTTQTYFLWMESLNVAHYLWHSKVFGGVKVDLEKKYERALNVETEEEAADALRQLAAEIPIFYR